MYMFVEMKRINSTNYLPHEVESPCQQRSPRLKTSQNSANSESCWWFNRTLRRKDLTKKNNILRVTPYYWLLKGQSNFFLRCFLRVKFYHKAHKRRKYKFTKMWSHEKKNDQLWRFRPTRNSGCILIHASKSAKGKM